MDGYMNAGGINEDVVRASFHTADEREMGAARAGFIVRNGDIR
jgi:hypothetical protein